MNNRLNKESHDTQQELIDSIRLMLDNVDEKLGEFQLQTKNNLNELLELNEKNMKLYHQIEVKLDEILNKSAEMVSNTIYVDNVKLVR